VVLLAYVPHSLHSGYHNSHLCIQDIYEPVMLCHQLVNPFLPAQAPNPPMPLEQSNALLNLSDPNIIIGPHKHHATERLLENGNPLVWKKNKAVPTGMTVSSASADKDNWTIIPCPQSCCCKASTCARLGNKQNHYIQGLMSMCKFRE